MRSNPGALAVLIALSTLAAAAPPQAAESYAPDLFAEMQWRHIGPFRGGRTKAAAGVPGQPNVFYVGVVNGGVLKSTDYGRTWVPIFDDQPTGSVGAIAVAPSNPDIVYVGSGEGLQRPDLSVGDGIYRSTDAGATWEHLGLRDGQQIPQIVVDPSDPDRIFVAVLGHPYGPNEQRGIFRSTDGGRTFDKVLYRDENTGGIDVLLDPRDADTVYAALWEAREGPWENGVFRGPGSGLYKSTDGGDTWRQLTGGLPTFEAQGLSRIGLAVAASMPDRLFATVEARQDGGLYRSDDAGDSWYLVNDDPRVTQRGSDFAEVKVDPQDADVVYTGAIVVWKSTDGGHTFEAIRGAPGGDDYQRLWINPDDPDIILVAADQGAIVTVNGGESWSSWYNQPTAQLYHVTADNAFPYRVCGGQQESGSVCVQSRGDDGQITFREWHPVGIEEYGYAAPDPLDPDIVYGGKVSRYDRRTHQVQNVGPRPLRDGDYRVVRTMPILFSPLDPRTLYFASNTLWKTTNGGGSWERISPDLSRETWQAPANVGKYRGTPAAASSRRGVIYTIAPSYLDLNTIWVGTDDGLIHVTRDGGVGWSDVTPAQLGPWAKVSLMDASHFDVESAYAAINTLRLDDLDRDRRRHWRRHHRQRRARGPGAPRPAVRRHRAGGLRVVRRRRQLAVAASEHARHVDPRPGDQGRRPGGGHPRARHLDPRRHHPAAPDHARGGRLAGPPVRAAARVAIPLEQVHRHAAAAGRAGGAEPARRRHSRLPDRRGGRRPGEPGDPHRGRRDRALLLQRRASRAAARGPERARVLAAAGAGAVGGAGTAPLRLGPALPSTREPAPRLPDLGDRSRHAGRAPGPLGASRALRRPPHRRRTDPRTAADRAHGPAGADAGGTDRAPVRAGEPPGGPAGARLRGPGGRPRPARRGHGGRRRSAGRAGAAAHPSQLRARRAPGRRRGCRRRPDVGGGGVHRRAGTGRARGPGGVGGTALKALAAVRRAR